MDTLHSDISIGISIATAAAVVAVLATVELWMGLHLLHRVSLSLPGILHAFLTSGL